MSNGGSIMSTYRKGMIYTYGLMENVHDNTSSFIDISMRDVLFLSYHIASFRKLIHVINIATIFVSFWDNNIVVLAMGRRN